MSGKYELLNDTILLMKSDTEQVTDAGVILPETATGLQRGRGEVTHMAASARELVPGVDIGTQVVYNPFAAVEIRLEGSQPHLAIRPGDIVAIIA